MDHTTQTKIKLKRLQIFTFAFLVFYLVSCKNEPAKNTSNIIHINNVVDLTHTLTSEFPFIPVKKFTYPFELIPMATLKENGVEANI